jgi:hypothetical protein
MDARQANRLSEQDSGRRREKIVKWWAIYEMGLLLPGTDGGKNTYLGLMRENDLLKKKKRE